MTNYLCKNIFTLATSSGWKKFIKIFVSAILILIRPFICLFVKNKR